MTTDFLILNEDLLPKTFTLPPSQTETQNSLFNSFFGEFVHKNFQYKKFKAFQNGKELGSAEDAKFKLRIHIKQVEDSAIIIARVKNKEQHLEDFKYQIEKNEKEREVSFAEFETYHQPECEPIHLANLKRKKEEEDAKWEIDSEEEREKMAPKEDPDEEIADFLAPADEIILKKDEPVVEEPKKSKGPQYRTEPKPWPENNYEALKQEIEGFEEFYNALVPLGVPEYEVKEFWDKNMRDPMKVLKKILFELHRKEMNFSTFKAIDGLLINEYKQYLEEFIIPLVDVEKYEQYEFGDMDISECFEEAMEFTERWDLEKQNKRDFEFIFEKMLQTDADSLGMVILKIKKDRKRK